MHSGEQITINHRSYRLDFVLSAGSGSYGQVWAATNPAGCSVALKIINAEAMAQADPSLHGHWHDHLEKEIAFLRRLDAEQSQHIITLLDHGQLDDQPVLVLERMQCHLGQWLAQQRKAGLPPPEPHQILDWIKQILTGLEAVHQAGFVYRDLKFSNILVGDNGALLKLADFGSLRRENGDNTRSFIGTPATMAPEQMLPVYQEAGVCEYAVDYRADYYALGLLLFTLITDEVSTEAQRQLSQLLTQYGQKGAARYHGRVGGINDREVALLQQTLERWIRQESESDDTHPAIALTKLITRLLASNPDDRPTDSANIYQVLDSVLITHLHTPTPTPAIYPEPILPPDRPVNLRLRRAKPRAQASRNPRHRHKRPARTTLLQRRSIGIIAALAMMTALAWAIVQPDLVHHFAGRSQTTIAPLIATDNDSATAKELVLPASEPPTKTESVITSTQDEEEKSLSATALDTQKIEELTPTIVTNIPKSALPEPEKITESPTLLTPVIAVPTSILTNSPPAKVTESASQKTSPDTTSKLTTQKRIPAKKPAVVKHSATQKKSSDQVTTTKRATSKKPTIAKKSTIQKKSSTRATTKKRPSKKPTVAKRSASKKSITAKRSPSKSATTRKPTPKKPEIVKRSSTKKRSTTQAARKKGSTRKTTATKTARANPATPKYNGRKVVKKPRQSNKITHRTSKKPSQPKLPPITLVAKPQVRQNIKPPPIEFVGRSQSPPAKRRVTRKRTKTIAKPSKKRSQSTRRSQSSDPVTRFRNNANRTAENIRRNAKTVGDWIDRTGHFISSEVERGLNSANRVVDNWNGSNASTKHQNRRSRHQTSRDNGFAKPPPR